MRLMIPLNSETEKRIGELAVKEHREYRKMAALLIDEALAARRRKAILFKP